MSCTRPCRRHEAPVGVCVDAREDKRGLWIKAELPKDCSHVSQDLELLGLDDGSCPLADAPTTAEVGVPVSGVLATHRLS